MEYLHSQWRPKLTNTLRAIERLETRRLFSTDLSRDFLSSDSESSQIVEPAPLIGSLPFVREGLFGSGIASVGGEMPAIGAVGTVSEVTFVAEAGTTTSFVITPTETTAVLTARVLQADGTVAAGPFVAPVPGAAVAIQPISLANGNYRLAVTSTAATSVKLKAARNAVIEDQIGDTTVSNELRIDGSLQNFGTGGVYGVVGSSSPLTKVSNSNRFIDISTRGKKVDGPGDNVARIVTTVGNSLFPAGDVTVSNHGAISASSTYILAYSNRDISSLSESTPPTLMAFWDDLFGRGNGGVYWLEESVAGVRTLIVQWENRPNYGLTGTVTFQLQLFASGPLLARFVYKDVIFGNSVIDFGKSATVGVVGLSARSQFSFNEASLANNDAIEIRSTTEVDEYEFGGAAGQSIDVAFDATRGRQADDTVVALYRGTTLLTTATRNPVASGLTVTNYDLGIHGFILPGNAIYTVKVTSLKKFDYYLAVSKNTILDTENSDLSLYPARTIVGISGTMVGFLNSVDEVDVSFLWLNAGRSVRLVLTRIGDNLGYLPATTLVPRVSAVAPDLANIASTSGFNESGEMILDIVALESGRHRILVKRIKGVGEYVLKVVPGVDAVAPALAKLTDENGTAATSATGNQQRSASPLDLLLDMNGDGELSPIDALLVINRLNQRAIKRDAVPAIVPQETEEEQATDLYFDINGDGLLSPLDALQVINRLNKRRV